MEGKRNMPELKEIQDFNKWLLGYKKEAERMQNWLIKLLEQLTTKREGKRNARINDKR